VRGTVTRRRVIFRSGAASLAALIALGVGGCSEDATADPTQGSRWPAAAAGGACQLLDYETVAEQTGTRFDTAGAATKDETFTCALTQAGRDYPDLTLAVTATIADQVIFTATVTPSGATAVKGLGTIAYRVGIAASTKTPVKSGPGVEIGWLSANGRLMIMRYTSATGTTAGQIDDLTPKLVALADLIDRAGPSPASI